MFRKLLLVCGALGSVLYVGIDVLAAIRYPAYHSFTDGMISELMATGAPTERLVDPLFLLYGALMLAFGIGVWRSGASNRVRTTGALLFAYAAIGLLGPTVFEMNVRGSGGDTIHDVLHIALTAVLVAFIFAIVAVGAALGSRSFRVYSFATITAMVIFGILTMLTTRGAGAGGPTPWLGLMERINIGAFLLWVVALAILLWRKPKPEDRGDGGPHEPSRVPSLGEGHAHA